MDNAFLIPIVEEITAALVGSALGDIIQIDSRRFALRFSVPPFRRLCLTLHHDLSELHLGARAAAPGAPTELAAVLSDWLGGAALAAVRKERDERVVELEFEGGRESRGFLVIELLGGSSNLLLLDEVRRVRRFLRSFEGAERSPAEGAPYVPPPARRDLEALSWGSRLLEKEARARAERGETKDRAKADLAARMEASAWAPCLYSTRPVDEIAATEELRPDGFFLSPFPLVLGEGLVRTDFASPSQAASTYSETLLRHFEFRDICGAITLLLRNEKERADKLVMTLEREGLEAAAAVAIRRKGELLLACIGAARKEGGLVEVIDYFDPSLPRLKLAIDPRLDLRANAEALFRRSRKLLRAGPAIAARLAATLRRSGALQEFSARIREARSAEELQVIEADLNSGGLVRMFRKPERREVGRRPAFVRVRELRTHDGYDVLVGKTATENDLLTFKIASPHDFWFHASGRAGAHVVVRNPRRSKELPESTLMEAAGIAAWYSKGPREGEIEVNYAMRKEVRKGKGMPPGMVTLRNYRTVLARPALPKGFPAEDPA
jgi:predicted ribosome quality control (RQC) complex YloA/Tae2 family protein